MRAIVLLSGGIDSTVCLAYALLEHRDCIVISFDYGQRHRVELESAAAICRYYSLHHYIVTLPSWGAESHSALLSQIPIPQGRTAAQIAAQGVAPTYVPARNSLFLTYALALAEVHDAQEVYMGSNADDCAPYPDCRPEFFDAFRNLAKLATKQAIEGNPPSIITPLIGLTKSQVISLGRKLNAPLELTLSCYSPSPESKACGSCDACILAVSRN